MYRMSNKSFSALSALIALTCRNTENISKLTYKAVFPLTQKVKETTPLWHPVNLCNAVWPEWNAEDVFYLLGAFPILIRLGNKDNLHHIWSNVIRTVVISVWNQYWISVSFCTNTQIFYEFLTSFYSYFIILFLTFLSLSII